MAEGNLIASRVVLLLQLCSAMACVWLVEQPGQSILMAYHRVDNLLRQVCATCICVVSFFVGFSLGFHQDCFNPISRVCVCEVYKKGFWMGAFNGPYPKRHYVLSNAFDYAKGIEGRGGYLSQVQRQDNHWPSRKTVDTLARKSSSKSHRLLDIAKWMFDQLYFFLYFDFSSTPC